MLVFLFSFKVNFVLLQSTIYLDKSFSRFCCEIKKSESDLFLIVFEQFIS